MYDLSVEKLTPGPIGAGVDPVRQNSGSEHIEEILEFEPNRRLKSSVVNGARPNFDVMTFEEVPGGTQVTQRFELVHSYVAAVLGGLLLRNREAERRVRTNRIAYWNRTKEILEGRQPVSP